MDEEYKKRIEERLKKKVVDQLVENGRCREEAEENINSLFDKINKRLEGRNHRLAETKKRPRLS